MILTVIQTRREQVQVDVTLPIYREHDVTPDYGPQAVWYYRIDGPDPEHLTQIGIHITTDDGQCVGAEIEVERASLLGDDADYILGRGQYASSAER